MKFKEESNVDLDKLKKYLENPKTKNLKELKAYLSEYHYIRPKSMRRVVAHKFGYELTPHQLGNLKRFLNLPSKNLLKSQNRGLSSDEAFQDEDDIVSAEDVLDRNGLPNGRPPTYDLQRWNSLRGNEKRVARHHWLMSNNEAYRNKTKADQLKAYNKKKTLRCNGKNCKVMLDPRITKSGYCQDCYWKVFGNKKIVKCSHPGCEKVLVIPGKYKMCRKHYMMKRYNQ